MSIESTPRHYSYDPLYSYDLRREGGVDGSVMMIGGGGNSCERAENGVGSTEADGCSIVEKGVVATEYDFGLKLIQDLFHPRHNLWIRCPISRGQ